MVDAVLSCSIATRFSTNLRSSAGNRTITGPIHYSGVFRLRPRKVLGPRITLTKRFVFHGIKLTPLARNNLARNTTARVLKPAVESDRLRKRWSDRLDVAAPGELWQNVLSKLRFAQELGRNPVWSRTVQVVVQSCFRIR